MGKKTVTVYGRNELAEYLEDVAAQLRKGSLPFGSESLEVPDNFQVRLSLKEKKHTLSCKLEWRWAVPEGRALPGFQPEPGTVPSSFRQLKKELARAFRAVKQAVNQGDTPDERLLAEFERLSRSFTDRAEPEWERAAHEYLGHMENLLRSIQDGRKEAAIHEIQDLQGRMVTCHREYK